MPTMERGFYVHAVSTWGINTEAAQPRLPQSWLVRKGFEAAMRKGIVLVGVRQDNRK